MPDIITGPGELAIIEFPGSKFNGEIVPALAQLVDDGIVTILDLVLVTTGDDGSVTAVEVTELDDEDAAHSTTSTAKSTGCSATRTSSSLER
jgi:Family of unknown function (DUF6325)